MHTATLSSLANGGQYGYSTTLQYNVGDFVDYVSSPPSDPFASPPILTRYYCYGPSLNKNPSTNPNLWSVSSPPATRFYAYGSGFDGVLRTTGSCATTIAATQALFNMLTVTSCPGNYPPQYLWLKEPLYASGLFGCRVGNVYVNRNMIGAAVGVQPFGGQGLSGTGPKAGGPHYVRRFCTEQMISINTAAIGGIATLLGLRES